MVFTNAQRTITSVLCMGAPLFAADVGLDEAKSTIEKWVETRQLISRTRADWQSDKDLLEQQIALFERELKGVEEAMGKVDMGSAQVGKEKAEAEASIAASVKALDAAKGFAGNLEAQIKEIHPKLPEPLQESLKPLLNRSPADANSKMAATERAQIVVGILNEVDKFQNSVSIFSEKRKNAGGEEIAVQVVYVGLGAAYFVNDAADFAGVGAPGAKGWEWTPKPEIAAAVADVVKIYRNEGGARFVALPVAIK